MNRRDLLQQLNRSAAALALGALFGPVMHREGARAAPLPRGEDPFTLGVASGMPRPDSLVLWTRLAPRPYAPLGGLPDAPVAVRWELAQDEGFSKGLRRGEVLARPADAHSVHVEVAGLPADTRFFYRFIAGDAVSPVGRSRTAPPPDADVRRLRLALASCQHYELGAFAAHREIAQRDLDLVLFVGDYIYDSNSSRYRVRAHEGPPPHTLQQYRARHATYKLDPDLRAAHAAHPWLLTWDDHEVENDYTADRSAETDSPEAFLRLRAAAYKAYFEHLPVSPSMAPSGAAMRIHDSFRWGRLAQLWTLDGRQFRSLQTCTNWRGVRGRLIEACDALQDSSRTVFGPAQEAWLAQGLAASNCTWKLLGQGTQISPSGLPTPFGERLFSDSWDGYPRARERLLQAIAGPQVSNAVCLGGDVHRHVAAQLRLRPHDPRSPVVAAEFTTTSVTSRGLSEVITAMMRSNNPDLLHARSDERGYALLDVTPTATHCDFRATSTPARRDAVLYSQARFVVERGRPGVLGD